MSATLNEYKESPEGKKWSLWQTPAHVKTSSDHCIRLEPDLPVGWGGNPPQTRLLQGVSKVRSHLQNLIPQGKGEAKRLKVGIDVQWENKQLGKVSVVDCISFVLANRVKSTSLYPTYNSGEKGGLATSRVCCEVICCSFSLLVGIK